MAATLQRMSRHGTNRRLPSLQLAIIWNRSVHVERMNVSYSITLLKRHRSVDVMDTNLKWKQPLVTTYKYSVLSARRIVIRQR